MNSRSSTSGRRAGTESTRNDLLRAGAELLQENGVRALSAREAAIRAKVNPAMVRYFFKNRLGFLAALMDYGFETVLQQSTSQPDASPFEALVRSIHRTPWLAQLLVQTVYAGDELRDHFEKTHAPKLLANYRTLLANGQAAGQIRNDLPESLAITGLISLIVFPVIAADSLQKMVFDGPSQDFEDTAVALVTRLYSRR